MEIISKFNNTIKMPTVLEAFKCIGPACSDSCCKGWEVEVDQLTFEAYSAYKESPLYKRWQKDVIVNESCEEPAVHYALMRLTPDKRCPFLASDMWCDIQGIHGEALLSVTCHLFPRTYNRIDGNLEMSMTLSCPEVARLVLGASKPLCFQDVPTLKERVLLSQDVNQIGGALANHPAKFLLPLRQFALDLLGRSEVGLWTRLALLNSFHIDFMPLHVPEGVDKIESLIMYYQGLLSKPLTKPTGYRVVKGVQIKVLEVLYNALPDYFSLGEGAFKAIQVQLIDRLIVEGTKSQRQNALNQWQIAFVLPFAKEHPYFFENYLRHFVFKYLYPFSEEGDPYMAHSLLVLRLYLIQVHLAVLGSQKGPIQLDEAVDVVQQLTKLWEHNRQFFLTAGECLMHEGLDGPEELLSLVPKSLGV